jgi:hypothetical protein
LGSTFHVPEERGNLVSTRSAVICSSMGEE